MRKKQILVTQKGMTLIQNRIQAAMDDLRHAQSQKGEAAEVGGNTWHDNFTFEDLVRQEAMLNRRLADLFEVQKQATIVQKPASTKVLSIGHVATLEDVESGKERTVAVGGYGETDLHSVPPTLDYTAPLIRDFVGHEVRHEAEVSIQSKRHTYILTAISVLEV